VNSNVRTFYTKRSRDLGLRGPKCSVIDLEIDTDVGLRRINKESPMDNATMPSGRPFVHVLSHRADPVKPRIHPIGSTRSTQIRFPSRRKLSGDTIRNLIRFTVLSRPANTPYSASRSL
jgi:hypothetical protein